MLLQLWLHIEVSNTELLAVNPAEFAAHIIFGSYICKFIQIYQCYACKLISSIYLVFIQH
uniref:Uncharacterized protein n=1 Tax=Setaria italica TaxID=4555 RepID=K4AHV0_SETIT